MNDVAVESYRPSDDEPFMSERQREYFRRKLTAWRESILAESRDTLEKFAQAMLAIAQEDPETLHDAPISTPISRPDEVMAAKTPILKWTP